MRSEAIMATKKNALVAAVLAALMAAPAAAQTLEEHRLRCNDPSDPAARIPACTALIGSGTYSGEILAFVFNSRGLGYLRSGYADRAIKDFDEAIRLSPSLGQAFNNRGLAYGNKGQSARAIQDFDQSIRLNPSNFASFANRCKERLILEQAGPAMADCQEALRLQPNQPSALFYRGVLHLKAGRFDAAIADCDAALQSGEDARVMYSRGVARRRKGDGAGGAADIAAAKAIRPDVAEVMAKWGVR